MATLNLLVCAVYSFPVTI